MRGTSVGEKEPGTAPHKERGQETTSAPAREDTPAGTVRGLRPVGRRRAGSTLRRTVAALGDLSLRRCVGDSVMERRTAARLENISDCCFKTDKYESLFAYQNFMV